MRKHLEYFDGAFDSTVTDKMKPENKPYVAYSKTDGVIYTIVPKEEGEIYTIYRAINYVDISNCTYNMVDLGLPSGLKWADRNVGAKSPEHYGSYFQWGDTNPYTYVGELTTQELVDLLNPLFGPGITVDNVKDILASQGVTGNDLTEVIGYVPELNREFSWNSYFDTIDGGSTFNKYNNNGGLTVLESIDDAATVHMGSQYRTPTIDEIRELVNNTTQTFIDVDGNEYSKEQAQNGVIESGKLKGIRFTSSNSNSIFIPAAGLCYDDALLYGISMVCELWSSSLDSNDDYNAAHLIFIYGGAIDKEVYTDRCYGLSVRGVQA